MGYTMKSKSGGKRKSHTRKMRKSMKKGMKKGGMKMGGMKMGGGIVSTAAAPVALYGLARMAQRRSRKSMRGGSVLGNALPSLVLYGLSKTFRGNKTRKNGRKDHSRRRR